MTTWIKPDDFDTNKHIIVKVNIQQFDREWKKNPFYVPSNQAAPTNLLKYVIWKKRHNTQNYKAEMPTITTGDDGEGNVVVGFVDGRHRYATYRDMGKRIISMMIEIEKLELFSKMLD